MAGREKDGAAVALAPNLKTLLPCVIQVPTQKSMNEGNHPSDGYWGNPDSGQAWLVLDDILEVSMLVEDTQFMPRVMVMEKGV